MSDPVIRLNEALGAPKVLVTRGTVTSAAAGPGTSSSSASWFRHWRSQLSLLTLILAACSGSDCVSGPLCGDGGGDPPPPVTGTISGRVTVGGTGISSVTVTLSNGSATTTGASGNYSFSGVRVGSYTVTIRNVSSEVTCGTTSLSVTISSSALQATAHFTCVPAANASISGAVTAEGFSVPNVEVVLSGPSPATAMTDANGQFSFTSLLAGAYTVMISGFSEGL